jgi:hypothetical protein
LASLVERVKHEIREVIPPAIFFFVAFQTISFTRALMLKDLGVELCRRDGRRPGKCVLRSTPMEGGSERPGPPWGSPWSLT